MASPVMLRSGMVGVATAGNPSEGILAQFAAFSRWGGVAEAPRGQRQLPGAIESMLHAGVHALALVGL
jgi:hypothetical protein